MGIVKDEALLECLGKNIVQIGIIVPDIDKAMAGMLDLFGLEPESKGDVVYEKVLYRGEVRDAPVRNAFYNYFNMQLEFLQPIGDIDTVWSDFANAGQRGLHHIRFDIEDNQKVDELMAEKGISIWTEGESLVTPGVTFTYYDTVEALGFVVEAVTKAPSK